MRIVTAVSIIIGIYFFSNVGLTNSGDSPQYRLTQALVDRSSLCLSDDDKYIYPDVGLVDGTCIVSGRGAGESIIAIPFYIFSKYMHEFIRLPYNGIRLGIDQNSGIEASTTMINSLFGSLCVVFVYKISVLVFYDKKSSIIASILYMVGTLNWKYSTIFYRHTSSLFFILLSTYLLIRLIKNRSNESRLVLIVFFISIAMNIFIEPTSMFFCIAIVLIYFTISIYFKKSLSSILLNSFILITTVITVNLPVFMYNFSLFRNPFNYGWESQSVNTWLANKQLTFSTPFAYSLMTNIFNPNIKINQNTFSQYLIDNEQIKIQQSYYYASKYNYKGVLAQSPFLLLIFVSPFILRNKRYYILLILLSITASFLSFKYIVFYSPNSYDTRFFLPIYAIFAVLTAPSISYILNTKNLGKRYAFGFIFFALALLSIFNGWVSTVENYAPHITGEKRIIATQLLLSRNFVSIFTETFPNIYNYKIYFIYITFFLLTYGVVRCFTSKRYPT